MGIKLFSSGRSDCGVVYPTDPNPSVFKIVSIQEFSEYTLVVVDYPNCTNFEGRKVLVMDMSANDIMSMEKLDPHFIEGNNIIARFVPTKKGIRLAKKICKGCK